jgi:hypothetical protein
MEPAGGKRLIEMTHFEQPGIFRHLPGIVLRAWTVCLAIGLTCAAAAAQQVQVTLNPAETHIDISVHDVHGGVHGSFRLKSGTVLSSRANGSANGEIVVDAAGGVTGNTTRDRKMNQDVLESQRDPDILCSQQGDWRSCRTGGVQHSGARYASDSRELPTKSHS